MGKRGEQKEKEEKRKRRADPKRAGHQGLKMMRWQTNIGDTGMMMVTGGMTEIETTNIEMRRRSAGDTGMRTMNDGDMMMVTGGDITKMMKEGDAIMKMTVTGGDVTMTMMATG